MKYIIVQAQTINGLEELVANKIATGWELLGGAFFAKPFMDDVKSYSRGKMCQTMIKKG